MASPVFELVRADLGLWVWELNWGSTNGWASQVESIYTHLVWKKQLLMMLQDGCSEFTLHLGVHEVTMLPISIPVKLSRLAAECGLEIEISGGF